MKIKLKKILTGMRFILTNIEISYLQYIDYKIQIIEHSFYRPTF